MLALASIIIAFAQPYIPLSNKNPSNKNRIELINIYIDNSFSMNGETEKGNALEVAKNYAFEFVKSLPDYSKLRIYSNDIKHYSNTLSKNQAIARIQELAPSPVSINLSELLKNIRIDLSTSQAQVYVLSDFQKSQADFSNIKPDSLLTVDFVQLNVQPTNNLVLDSCWFEKANHNTNAPKRLFVQITNHSNKELKKIPIHLDINDSLKSVGSIDVDKNSTQTTSLRYTDKNANNIHAKISIEDYPITYDNHLYYSYKTVNGFKVLSINQNTENNYISKLFKSEENFEIKNIHKTELYNESINQYQLIILNEIESIESGFSQTLRIFLLNGGSLLFVPGNKFNSSVNTFLSEIRAPNFKQLDTTKQRISSIELNSNVYKNVFQELKNNARLPDIFKYYKLTNAYNTGLETLWETPGGEKLFTKTNYGNGQLYLLSLNLRSDWTNLTTHPLLVPSIINLCKSNFDNNKIYYEIGKNEAIKIEAAFTAYHKGQFHIKNDRIGIDVIPQKLTNPDQSIQLRIQDQIRLAENYKILINDSVIQKCSYNYSRSESKLSYYNLDEIENEIKALDVNYSVISSEKMKMSELNNEKRNGRNFWRIFILLTIIFFLTEGLLKL